MSRARSIADIGDDVGAGGSLVTTASPSLGRRNLIINGAMQVAQRGTSSTGTSYATVDRFRPVVQNMDQLAITQSQSTDAPDGFSTSYKIAVDTAETSLDSDEAIAIYQPIEAQNLQHLQFGSSGAKSLTLSFWVKASITGTYSTTFFLADDTRARNETYTINSADTWEYKTLTIEGDTTGVIDNDNNVGMSVYFGISGGSARIGTELTAWGAYTSDSLLGGQTANTIATTTNATFQITGVQLEVGDTATPFEHRSYGEELAACQRYFYRTTADSSSNTAFANMHIWNTAEAYGVHFFKTTMRAKPTGSVSASNLITIFSEGTTFTSTGVALQNMNENHSEIFVGASGMTASRSGWARMATSSYVDFDAEL